MRSVVVVFPASICAMIPMLRVSASGNSRIGSPDEPRPLIASAAWAISSSFFFVSRKTTGSPRPSVLLSDRLPAVMGERAVRLGHAVHVLALLHCGARALKSIEQLARKLLRHTFAFAVSRYA